MTSRQIKIDTSIGCLYLVSTEKGLSGVHWKKQDVQAAKISNGIGYEILLSAEKQILEYLAGNRRNFDLPLDICGTVFQKSVWQQLTKIPFGETRSYKQISISVKRPIAYRAVGTAIGKNALSLIVPCHRVIASDGTLGGYAGGLEIKEKLLNLESARTQSFAATK